jgi:hypothetical protein
VGQLKRKCENGRSFPARVVFLVASGSDLQCAIARALQDANEVFVRRVFLPNFHWQTKDTHLMARVGLTVAVKNKRKASEHRTERHL